MMALNGRSKKLPKPALKLPLTSSQSQLEPTRLSLEPAKFRKGELVHLNAFGQILCVDRNNATIGIIMSNAHSCILSGDGDIISYWVYDVFVGNQLITQIPQNFMERIEQE
jgi:hypothetical protein